MLFLHDNSMEKKVAAILHLRGAAVMDVAGHLWLSLDGPTEGICCRKVSGCPQLALWDHTKGWMTQQDHGGLGVKLLLTCSGGCALGKGRCCAWSPSPCPGAWPLAVVSSPFPSLPVLALVAHLKQS